MIGVDVFGNRVVSLMWGCVIRQWWCMNKPTPRNSPRACTMLRTKILCLASCVTACDTHSESQRSWKGSNAPSRPAWCIWLADDDDDDDDDVGLNVLGCRADILGTNCNKLLKLKINRGWGWDRFTFSTCNHVQGVARRLLFIKHYSLGIEETAILFDLSVDLSTVCADWSAVCATCFLLAIPSCNIV